VFTFVIRKFLNFIWLPVKNILLSELILRNIHIQYDIYFATKPLHLLCKTVGLYPHSFNQNMQKNSRQLNVLWSFSLILLLVVCFIYRLVTTIQNPTRRPHWLADVIYVCTDYVAGLGWLIFGVRTQRNKCQLINYKIKKIDELFYLHNYGIHMYKKKRFTVIFSVILIILSTITLCCFMVYSWEDFVPSNFLICDQLCYYILFIVSFRHVLNDRLLRDKFKGINLQIVSTVHGILDVNFDSDVKNFCAVIQFANSRQRKMYRCNGIIEQATSYFIRVIWSRERYECAKSRGEVFVWNLCWNNWM
jgi:hypothetical protein